MPFCVSLRIPVQQFLPLDLQNTGRFYVNVSAYSLKAFKKGALINIPAICRDAEVVECNVAGRPSNTYNFRLDN